MEGVTFDSGRGEVYVSPDAVALARTAAGEIVRVAEEAVVQCGRFTIALGGGSTPRDLYRLLADPSGPFRARFPWKDTHFFWGDERHVPPDHPDSNFRMAKEAMLDSAAVPAENIHRIGAEDPIAEEAAATYETVLRRFFGESGTPRFDVILLGIGPEGHTASLFPHSRFLREEKLYVGAPWVQEFKTFRITLTPPVLNSAANVAFLVSGEKKREILRTVLLGDRKPDLYPAQIVKPKEGRLLWFVDAAAARGWLGLRAREES
jgi:6-phosphogluconolactonase